MRHTDSTETPEALSPEQLEALLPKWVQIVRDAPVLLLYLHGSYEKGTQTLEAFAIAVARHCGE